MAGVFRPHGDPADKVLLVSFPKSGSNWLRYCIEHFSGMRTPGTVRRLLVHDGPTIIERRHFLDPGGHRLLRSHSLPIKSGRRRRARRWRPALIDWALSFRKRRRVRGFLEDRRVILILRNPFALYSRVRATAPEAMSGYVSNIELFERCRRDKLLVYYEDLVRDPAQISAILEFIGIAHDMSGFEMHEHTARSLAFYNKGADQSRLATVGRQSMEPGIDRSERMALRVFLLERLGRPLFERYLGRYEAAILH